MRDYRSVTPLEEMPGTYLESGHFWIQEYVTGRILRFQMDDSGLLTFGTRGDVLESDRVPPHYYTAVDTVRENLDRDRLREGTDAVESYTFFGVAPLAGAVDYDWDAIPGFLGLDIWDGSQSAWTSEDVTTRVFESIGLATVPSFEKEVPARDVDPARMSIPRSNWAAEPAAGLLLRKKNGAPAVLFGPDVDPPAWEPASEASAGGFDLEGWIEEVLTQDRVTAQVPDGRDALKGGDIDVLTTEIAAAIAQREFDTVGPLLEGHPHRFETAVRERLRSLRRAAYD